MFVRLVRFGFGPGKHAAAEALAAELVPAISDQKGCNHVSFFGNAEDGEYGIVVLWETQADADAASAVISPRLQAGLAGNVKAPPDIGLFKVIQSGS